MLYIAVRPLDRHNPISRSLVLLIGAMSGNYTCILATMEKKKWKTVFLMLDCLFTERP